MSRLSSLLPRVARSTALIGTLAMLATCGGGGDGIVRTTPTPATIAITPAGPLTLLRGGNASVAATVTGSTSAVRWRSSDVAVATVTADNPATTARITAVAAGSATIVAELVDQPSVSASVGLTVTAPPPATVTITPATATANVGDSVFFTAQLGGPAGADGRLAECRTSAPAVATARLQTTPPIGCRAIGVTPGTTTITAVLDNGNAASAQFTVNANRDAIRNLVVTPPAPNLEVGAALLLQAAVESDNPQVTVTRRFVSANAAIAAVTAEGRLSGVAPGTTTVTVTVEGSGGGTRATTLSQVVTVTVRPNVPALRGFTIAPRTPDVSVGRTQALTITADRADTSVRATPAFISRTPAIATVGAVDGVITGVAAGTATIVVSVTGVGTGFATTTLTDSITVTVRALPPAITNLRVTPSPATIGRGTTQALTARVDSANASVRPTFSYASSNTAIATVSAAGVVTGVANGAASITVTATGSGTDVASTTLTATVPITVIDRPAISNLVASPDTIRLISVGRQAPIAVRYDSVSDARVTVTYASTSPSVATVSNNGIVTVQAPGTANIIVTAVGTSSTASTATLVDTVAVGAWQIAVSPPSLTVAPGTTAQFTANVTGGFLGTPVPLLWRSANPAVATVDGNGLVTAITPGLTSVSAQSPLDPSSSGGASAVTVPCRATVTANWGQSVTDSVTVGNCSFGTSDFAQPVTFNGVPTQASFTASSATTTASWRPNIGSGTDAWRLATGPGGNRVSVVNPSGQPARMNMGSDAGATTPSGRFTIAQSTTPSSACDFIYVVRAVTFSANVPPSTTCVQRIFLNPRLGAAATLSLTMNGLAALPALTTFTVDVRNEFGTVIRTQVYPFPQFAIPNISFTANLPGGSLYEIRVSASSGTTPFNYTINF